MTFSKILLKYISKNWVFFGFPVVQWLGLCASTEGGLGSIPSWRSRIPQAAWCRQKKKKKKILLSFQSWKENYLDLLSHLLLYSPPIFLFPLTHLNLTNWICLISTHRSVCLFLTSEWFLVSFGSQRPVRIWLKLWDLCSEKQKELRPEILQRSY